MSLLIGRFLQLIGLVMLPVALMVGLFQDKVRLEVMLLFIGGLIFTIGWILGKKPE
jgi:uncharacterized membrane protein YedE/YeeE